MPHSVYTGHQEQTLQWRHCSHTLHTVFVWLNGSVVSALGILTDPGPIPRSCQYSIG